MLRFLTLALLAPLAMAAPAIEVGARYVVFIGAQSTFPGGRIDLATSGGFEATAELFLTRKISAQLGTTFLMPEAILFPEAPPREDIDLDTLGVNPIAMTFRYHFRPRRGISPYLGAGGALVTLGNLDDRFGSELEVDFEPTWTWVAEGGLRFPFRERVAFDFGFAYVPIDAPLKIRRNDAGVRLPSSLEITPVLVRTGVNWRF